VSALKSREVLRVGVPASMGLTLRDVRDEGAMRRYAAMKGKTLPGDIIIEVDVIEDSHNAFLVRIYENPDTDR